MFQRETYESGKHIILTVFYKNGQIFTLQLQSPLVNFNKFDLETYERTISTFEYMN